MLVTIFLAMAGARGAWLLIPIGLFVWFKVCRRAVRQMRTRWILVALVLVTILLGVAGAHGAWLLIPTGLLVWFVVRVCRGTVRRVRKLLA
jgi:hypothetical protein